MECSIKENVKVIGKTENVIVDFKCDEYESEFTNSMALWHDKVNHQVIKSPSPQNDGCRKKKNIGTRNVT